MNIKDDFNIELEYGRPNVCLFVWPPIFNFIFLFLYLFPANQHAPVRMSLWSFNFIHRYFNLVCMSNVISKLVSKQKHFFDIHYANVIIVIWCLCDTFFRRILLTEKHYYEIIYYRNTILGYNITREIWEENWVITFFLSFDNWLIK